VAWCVVFCPGAVPCGGVGRCPGAVLCCGAVPRPCRASVVTVVLCAQWSRGTIEPWSCRGVVCRDVAVPCRGVARCRALLWCRAVPWCGGAVRSCGQARPTRLIRTGTLARPHQQSTDIMRSSSSLVYVRPAAMPHRLGEVVRHAGTSLWTLRLQRLGARAAITPGESDGADGALALVESRGRRRSGTAALHTGCGAAGEAARRPCTGRARIPDERNSTSTRVLFFVALSAPAALVAGYAAHPPLPPSTIAASVSSTQYSVPLECPVSVPLACPVPFLWPWEMGSGS
jgi:hypothetical protein